MGWFQISTPNPAGTGCIKGVQGASGASGVHFGENFIEQKLQGTSNLVRFVIFLDPKSWSGRTLAPCPSGARVTDIERVILISKLCRNSPIVIWLCCRSCTLNTGFWGGIKGAQWGFGASAVGFGRKFNIQICWPPPTYFGWVTFLDFKFVFRRVWAWCASGPMVNHI